MKFVWSSQSELVNDFDRFDWCRLRMYTWISASDVSRSSPIDDRRYVFSRLRVEKGRCGVAMVTSKVTRTCSMMDRFGYRDAFHAVLHPVQSWVVPLQHASVASTAQTRLGACRDCRR